MMLLRAGLSVASLLVTISVAQAASVTLIQGEALVSRGDGYEALKGPAIVNAGDIVVPSPGSSMKVTFSNGCAVFLGGGMVFSVPEVPPCGGPTALASNGLQSAETAIPQDWSAVTQTTAFNATQPDYVPYLLGAAAIGGIAAAVGGLGGGSNDSPASP
ncbi:hypothetical protein [Hyphomicrobium facile]|uniref:Uncharacterized protein n=1 Tax=Hyphomicrobium facile TaxID=51670 RepID=A0A1I7NJ13_9HYPH|nr:hypothetical protein [Hyphomicrobium facile]SFV34619.1 hypothetical protein SAMN04488557_2382 [Hyphomicrobium facile]